MSTGASFECCQEAWSVGRNIHLFEALNCASCGRPESCGFFV
jgi:hypothetical protein